MKYQKTSLIILSLTLLLIASCKEEIKPLDDPSFLQSIYITGCDDLDEGMSKGQDIFFPSFAEMHYYDDPPYLLGDGELRLIAPDQCISKKTLKEGKCLDVPKELQKLLKNYNNLPKIQIRGHLAVDCPKGYECRQTAPESYIQRITKYWNEYPKEQIKEEIIINAEEPELKRMQFFNEDEWQRIIEVERHERIQLDINQATFGACMPEQQETQQKQEPIKPTQVEAGYKPERQ